MCGFDLVVKPKNGFNGKMAIILISGKYLSLVAIAKRRSILENSFIFLVLSI